MKKNKTNRDVVPAYKDRDLSDRPGERWSYIPFVDGYYLISDFGRVKRLAREAVGKMNTIVILPEKIIKTAVVKKANNYVKDYRCHLSAMIQLDKRRFSFSIARLVYYCFVKPFTLDDTYVDIGFKNDDPLDIRPENLMRMEKREVVRRMIETGRKANVYSKRTRKIGNSASCKITGKLTSQYNSKGKLIKTYKSTMEASRATGVNHTQIRNTLAGRGLTAGGFYWRHGNERKIDIRGLLEQKRQKYIRKRGTKITQYDLDGNPISYHFSLASAAKAIGAIGYSCIFANIRGILKTAHGYRWKTGFNKTKLKP